jgi:hypothetical protein
LENPHDNVFGDRIGLELPDRPAASDALVDFHVSPLEDRVVDYRAMMLTGLIPIDAVI